MEVKRKPNESVGSLMRRFSRLVQQSRLLVRAKSARYFTKKPNERVEKNRAIMREELRGLRKRMERFGQYEEEVFEDEKKKLKQKLGL
ncbi:MAG: 30S ribosomal protein S21 [Candidatus Yanofskybacteria bacterium]|nr:30S ribosomal protein S21 [Candidatus Yanofskybacteria bacterium]